MSRRAIRLRRWWATLAIAVVAGHFCAAAEVKSLQAGDGFPDLAGFNLVGELPDRAGARVVLVDFWASWCAPCKASFPVYDELHAKFGSRGLVIVAVNVDQDARAMEKFMQRMRPTFATVRDAEQKLVATVAPPTMPTAFLLDARGVVRFVHAGFHGESSRQKYIDQITLLLAEQS